MNNLFKKINNQIKRWQKQGVPILFWRDEQKKAPSVSLTMMLISFGLCVFALINKFAKIVEGVDIDNSLQLFMICAGLYFGRSLSKKIEPIEEDEDLKE
jgi:hypothetical protein